MLRIAGTIEESFVDGPGVRYTIFCQGCLLNCKGCQNPQTHSLSGGILVSIDDLFNDIQKYKLVSGVTFSGGEPSLQAKELLELAKRLQESGYNIWMYSGYTIENLIKKPDMLELLKYIDVLVDGPYIESEKTLDLPFRGSKNQRLINVKEYLNGRYSIG